MATKKEIKEYYDNATYRKLHGFLYVNPRVELAWKNLIKKTEAFHPSYILEIGCGIGEISCRLSDHFPSSSVIGFDISRKSIDIAQRLFKRKNLKYVQSDNLVSPFGENKKIDMIILMDVYEHIEKEARQIIFDFIKENISKDAMLFLSCPTPQHLQFLRLNDPSEIQPVDEDIDVQNLLTLATNTNLSLVYYEQVSVWRGGDYFHAVLSNQLRLQARSDYSTFSNMFSLKKNMQNRLLERFFLKKTAKNTDVFSTKKALIEEQLGKDTLQKVLEQGKK